MGWDVDQAVKYLQDHAAPKSTAHCARYTANAIDAGGMTIVRPATGAAQDFGPALVQAGFYEFTAGEIKEFQKGDVAVIRGFGEDPKKGIKGHPYGHMAMYDGQKWISDFVQNGTGPYPDVQSDYTKAKPSYKIYRYNFIHDAWLEEQLETIDAL